MCVQRKDKKVSEKMRSFIEDRASDRSDGAKELRENLDGRQEHRETPPQSPSGPERADATDAPVTRGPDSDGRDGEGELPDDLDRRQEHHETQPQPPSRPENADAADAPATREPVSDWKKRYGAAFIAIEYRPDAAEAWRRISKLPDSFKEKFLAQLNDDPKGDVSVIVASVEAEHQRDLNPFDDPALNEAYGEALKLGEAAASEFRHVVETLGDAVESNDILGTIFNKYAGSAQKTYKEKGEIGGREYFINLENKCYIKSNLGNFISFPSKSAARDALNIPNKGPRHLPPEPPKPPSQS